MLHQLGKKLDSTRTLAVMAALLSGCGAAPSEAGDGKQTDEMAPAVAADVRGPADVHPDPSKFVGPSERASLLQRLVAEKGTGHASGPHLATDDEVRELLTRKNGGVPPTEVAPEVLDSILNQVAAGDTSTAQGAMLRYHEAFRTLYTASARKAAHDGLKQALAAREGAGLAPLSRRSAQGSALRGEAAR